MSNNYNNILICVFNFKSVWSSFHTNTFIANSFVVCCYPLLSKYPNDTNTASYEDLKDIQLAYLFAYI